MTPFPTQRAERLVLLLCTGLLLWACTTAPEPDIEMPTTDELLKSCGGEDFEGWIGQTWNETKVALAGPNLRLITPGMAVTMDYNPQRLNVELDDSGTISALFCG